MQYLSLTMAIAVVVPMAAFCQTTTEIRYVSAADNTEQPAMFYVPETGKAVPLVVVLHTWSGDYRQDSHAPLEKWCIQKGWAYLHPNFRGPNNRPEATGSPLVVQDIVSAVAYACHHANIDTSAVYLVGTSGGGYTALIMAGKHPELWAGVSAWVPISDLRAWYHECKATSRRYYMDIAASCGGAPGDTPDVDREYRERSPLTFLANAGGVNLHINAGIHDGHTGSVPVSHSLRAFNEVARPDDIIAPDDIRYMVETEKVPKHLQRNIANPAYGNKQPVFRRVSGRAVITLFEGGHELVPEAATSWMEMIHKIRKLEASTAGTCK